MGGMHDESLHAQVPVAPPKASAKPEPLPANSPLSSGGSVVLQARDFLLEKLSRFSLNLKHGFVIRIISIFIFVFVYIDRCFYSYTSTHTYIYISYMLSYAIHCDFLIGQDNERLHGKGFFDGFLAGTPRTVGRRERSLLFHVPKDAGATIFR